MDKQDLEGLEVALPSVVMQAAHNFAEALAETPQFVAFEQATYAFRLDANAQQAFRAYQEKERSLRSMPLINDRVDEQLAELQKFRQSFLDLPVMQAYLQAQADLSPLCQQIGDDISAAIEMDFSAACRTACCG